MAKTFKSFVYDIKAIFKPEIINGWCYGKFRLSPEYKNDGAPFGFDWIRTGDAKDYVEIDEPYRYRIGRYYEGEKIKPVEKIVDYSKLTFVPDLELYEKLCNSYPISNISIYPSPNGRRTPYHVPVLSIYPYSGNNRDIAKLILELNIIKSPNKIELIYNTELLEIKVVTNIPIRRGVHKVKLSIKCIQEFSEDQFIRVVSFNSKGKKKNAGMLRVCKNHKQLRRELNVLLVNTKILSSDKMDAIPLTGDTKEAQLGLTYFLRHALMNPIFDIVDLDLGLNDDFLERMFRKKGDIIIIIQKHIGEYGALTTLEDTETTVQLLTNQLTQIKNTEDYDTIIFCLGMGIGRLINNKRTYFTGITSQKNVLLTKDYQAVTACHETLHTLRLEHTFSNMKYHEDVLAEYTYEKYTTDNVMDYPKDEVNRTNLWEWQWKKIRTKGFPEK